MVKIKTTIITKKTYSKAGKSYWIEYADEVKSIFLNLAKYTLEDLKNKSFPCTIKAEEDDYSLSLKIESDSEAIIFTDIFNEIIKDLSK